MRRGRTAVALLGCLLGGCVAQPARDGGAADLAELTDRHLYLGDSAPLRSDAAQLIAAYRPLQDEATAPALQREAKRRLADLTLEGVLPAGALPAPRTLYLELLNGAPANPDNEQLLYGLARSYAEEGDGARQFAVMGELLTYFPESPYRTELLFRRAEYLFSQGRNREALEHYETLLEEGELTPFYEKSLYKLAWSELRLQQFEQAYDHFVQLVQRKLTPQMLAQGAPLPALPLSRGDRELVEDVLRGATLALSLGEPGALVAMLGDEGRRPYAYLCFAAAIERYLEQERYEDAAQVASAYLQHLPRHPYAPVLQLKLLESYRLGGFRRQWQQAREAFAERYQPQGEHWRFLPAAAQALLDEPLRTTLRALASEGHALAQQSGREAHYARAAHWYRLYIGAFPEDAETAQMSFLLGELLFEQRHYDEAVSAYEKSAYHYPRHDNAARAGYAALIAYRNHEEGLEPGEYRDRWHWLAVSSALNFVNSFGDDARAPRVLANAAQELYAMHLYRRAADTSRLLLMRHSGLEPEVQLTAWTVLGYSEFELGRFAEAERAYRKVLEMAPPGDTLQPQRIEWLAAAIYKQAERARAEGYPESAAGHFRRVGELAPGSKIEVTSDYDAAAALIAAGRWEAAIAQLIHFRKRYPKSPLMTDVSDKLAVAYMKAGREREAAQEFEALCERKGEEREKREMLWLAAELYEKLDDTPARLRTYLRYVTTFPAPLEPAVEMRWKLAQLYEQQGNGAERDRWYRDIIATNAAAKGGQTPRSRFLAASAQLAMARPLFEAFDAVQLVEPLQQNLLLKKAKMEQALALLSRVIDQQVAESTTNAAFLIGELHRRFARALLESERPANLNAEELEQYVLLLEEQAYPFEESALQVHEANVARITQGFFDEWTRRSLEVLAQMRPARYAKQEQGEEVFDAQN